MQPQLEKSAGLKVVHMAIMDTLHKEDKPQIVIAKRLGVCTVLY